ncbi:MAG: cell division protein FtsH, partial [Chloroflexota bacterium]|nr:cell division protein FtsH [Chloroflexota bacterium]
LAVALGGRAAEELIFDDVTTGAENDLEMVTAIIRQMVTRWGMSPEVGLLVQAERQDQYLGGAVGARDASEQLSAEIDAAMEAIVSERYAFTQKLLAQHRHELDRLAALLLEHESVDAEDIQRELGWPDQTLDKSGREQPAAA